MSSKKNIVCVVGTRPEGIKMAPVILALKNVPWVDCKVISTAQHRELLDGVLDTFGIEVDADLNLMQPNQSLSQITGRAFLSLEEAINQFKADMVIAQGDTTTVMVAGMTSFYLEVPFCHVEAGLRTGDIQNPFPEEMNRVVVSKVTQLHFAPTEQATKVLSAEGVSRSNIFLTGNTVIDALLQVRSQTTLSFPGDREAKKLILVTAHRRENFGEPLKRVFDAIRQIANERDDVHFLYPVHPNPNVRQFADEILGNNSRVTLCAPLDYAEFIGAMDAAYMIVTDSGGVQEEAPALGKPVLVMRNETERPEAVKHGVVRLVGTDNYVVKDAIETLLDDPTTYRNMARGVSPYGDGKASIRIVQAIADYFDQSVETRIPEFNFESQR